MKKNKKKKNKTEKRMNSVNDEFYKKNTFSKIIFSILKQITFIFYIQTHSNIFQKEFSCKYCQRQNVN